MITIIKFIEIKAKDYWEWGICSCCKQEELINPATGMCDECSSDGCN